MKRSGIGSFPRSGDLAVTPDGREVAVVSTEFTPVTGRSYIPTQRIRGINTQTGEMVVSMVARGSWRVRGRATKGDTLSVEQ